MATDRRIERMSGPNRQRTRPETMSPPPDLTRRDQREPLQDVYEQYWWHARHVEVQMWSYTRIWALVLTGIFTLIGTDLPGEAKGAVALFGALLSGLGFFVVYSLRVPFLAFALTSEAMAINEFGLPLRYRRFFSTGADFRADKGVDIPDVLLIVYAVVATALVFTAGIMFGYVLIGGVAAIIVCLGLAGLYVLVINPKFTEEKRAGYRKVSE